MPVIFYGAGAYAASNFDSLNEKYNPVAFADNDMKKHGTEFCGLPILSFEEMEEQLPGCMVYISALPGDFSFIGIANTLINKGFDKTRIINLGNLKKYISCPYLESSMNMSGSEAGFCCGLEYVEHPPLAKLEVGQHYKNIAKFEHMREEIISALNSNKKCSCTDCVHLKDAYWEVDRKISAIVLTVPTLCNFKCIYCRELEKYKELPSLQGVDSTLDFFDFLKKEGYITQKTEVVYAWGELTIHPHSDKLLNAVGDNPVTVFTNASAYNEKLHMLISRPGSRLTCSMDAGTKETFEKVKGVNLWDKVCDNLLRYSKNGNIYLKYILLEGVNDNERDIVGFIELCKKIDCRCVYLSRCAYEDGIFGTNALNMLDFFILKAKESSINIVMPEYIHKGRSDVDILQ